MFRCDHAQTIIIVLSSMRKGERKRSRLNVDPPRNLKNRLEADTLLADISGAVVLGRFADGANSSYVAFREAILIRIDDDSIGVEFED